MLCYIYISVIYICIYIYNIYSYIMLYVIVDDMFNDYATRMMRDAAAVGGARRVARR